MATDQERERKQINSIKSRLYPTTVWVHQGGNLNYLVSSPMIIEDLTHQIRFDIPWLLKKYEELEETRVELEHLRALRQTLISTFQTLEHFVEEHDKAT
jgi:hypothetical protein